MNHHYPKVKHLIQQLHSVDQLQNPSCIADLGNQQEEKEGQTEDKPLVFNELEQYVFETFVLFMHTG